MTGKVFKRAGFTVRATLIVVVLIVFRGGGAFATTMASSEEDEPRFLRVVSEADRSVALEIAARTYEKPDGSGPRVVAVGAVHIGEAAYYRAVQERLDRCDLVLYESVKPAGAGGAGGEGDEERIASTRAALEFVAAVASTCHTRSGAYPADAAMLRTCAAEIDDRLPRFVDAAMVDAWGRPLEYECCRVLADGGPPTPRVFSLGSDGAPGGMGSAADLEAVFPAEPLPLGSEEVSLQGELASALGLAFQLEAIEYGQPNWYCSDMALDQVQREMKKRGLDFTLVEQTLAGASLPARLVKWLLGLLRLADTFTEGAATDTVKVALIEMLGDESLIELSLAQFDAGFADVLIGMRNQVVMDDLKPLVAAEEPVGSVAIFYGAGHLPDLEARLADQFGYVSTEAVWLPGIVVDLRRSALSRAEVARVRLMVRRMIRQISSTGERGAS